MSQSIAQIMSQVLFFHTMFQDERHYNIRNSRELVFINIATRTKISCPQNQNKKYRYLKYKKYIQSLVYILAKCGKIATHN